MAHLYCNGGNRFNFVSIRNYTQNNFGGGYSYGCSMPSFGGIFSNWGTGIYNGCACNGGWNWSTFGGNALGSLVGSFLGMLCGGNNGLYSGIGNTSGLNQGQRATGNNGNGKDTDFAKIDSVHKNINKPSNDVKDILNKCELDNCDKLNLKQYFKGKLETLEALEKGLDGVNDTENKTYIDNLKNQLKQLATDKGIVLTDDAPASDKTTGLQETDAEGTKATTKDGSDTQINGSNNEDPSTINSATQTTSLTVPGDISWNEFTPYMLPEAEDLELPDDCTAPKAQDIYKAKIIQVKDLSDNTNPIVVKKCQVSDAGEKTKGFPEILEITSRSGKKWYYHYEGERGDYSVYITRDTDKNKNVYLLCEQGGELKLIQDDNFNGYGIEDTQNG